MIPFNRPFLAGKELEYIAQTVKLGKTSGNGYFTKQCQGFFERQYGFAKCLLTTSCTDALEMAAILAEIGPGDEVIVPSFTFVSTALAFVRQGATVRFVDSCADNPNMDVEQIEPLINARTRAIVPVHYAGVACDMKRVLSIARKHGLLVIGDSAQAIDSFYTGDLQGVEQPWHGELKRRSGAYPLGGIGHFGCMSFHETKNIQCGEGGMLIINDPRFVKRAEIIWEKGTNRADYARGRVDKYEWVDIGSSFLPSGITAAFLWAQLEALRTIQNKRVALWNLYRQGLQPLADQGAIELHPLPAFATNNAHVFYFVCASGAERGRLIAHLAERGIQAVPHYRSLHDSAYYRGRNPNLNLVHCERYVNCLVRLPLFCALKPGQVRYIVRAIKAFYA